jgi:ribokinase
MNNDNQFDFIGIGDTLIDAFIKLSTGHTQETAKGAELCIPYGAKIPFDSVTVIPGVGNSANACVSASRLGMKSALVTYLGNDANGQECIDHLAKDGVATNFISRQNEYPTNYHYVLWFGDDRTILVKHAEFASDLPDIGTPKWLYLSSLGSHTKELHFKIVDYKKSHPDMMLAFQPGTFQLHLKHELADLYKVTDVVCMNKEEAEELLDIYTDDMKVLMDKLGEMGPHTVIITDGHHGSYMKYENSYFVMPIYPDIGPPYERTGAGDAFFSTFISYLAKGYDAPYAIKRAPINSASVVLKIGAQEGLLTEEQLEDYLKKAPESYQLKILE